jgi:cation transport ATPase
MELTADSYLTIASIQSGFGITAMMFRVQRELYVREERKEENWLAWADYLVIISILLSLLLVVLPLVTITNPANWFPIAAASCAAAAVLLAVYPIAIVCHYGIPFFKWRSGTCSEKLLVVLGIVVAVIFARAALHGAF